MPERVLNSPTRLSVLLLACALAGLAAAIEARSMQQIELIEPPPPGAEPAGQLGLPANIAAAAPPLSATTLVSSSATAASCSALIGSLFGDW